MHTLQESLVNSGFDVLQRVDDWREHVLLIRRSALCLTRCRMRRTVVFGAALLALAHLFPEDSEQHERGHVRRVAVAKIVDEVQESHDARALRAGERARVRVCGFVGGGGGQCGCRCVCV